MAVPVQSSCCLYSPDTYHHVIQDTFLDVDHVRESFPGHRVEVVNNSGHPTPVRPFRVTFPDPPAAATDDAAPLRAGGKRKAAESAANGAADGAKQNGVAAELPLVLVESYKPPDPGPYPQDEPPQNTVRFTPVQVEAIRAGAQPGLTMVVGPPGVSRNNAYVNAPACDRDNLVSMLFAW